MDKPPKRRVLSLSLSQPSKQQKKLKLRRHVSASSSKETEDTQTCSETSSSKRDTSNSPIFKSHIQQTRNEALRQSSSVENDLPHGTSKSKLPSQDSHELQGCIDPDADVTAASRIDCDTDELRDNRAFTEDCFDSKLCEDSPEETSTFQSKIENGKHSDVSSEGKQEDTECGPVSNMDISSTDKNISGSAETDIEVLQCPLCHKIFEKLLSKTTHLKNCASKRKLPTHQLIEILELQKRQAAERRALGLPDVQPLPAVIKKSGSLKKENRQAPKMDSNLQLAMALSLSMQDQKLPVEHFKSSEISLDRFGFTSKSVLEAAQTRPNPPSTRGKANTVSKSKPILLTRTAEERQQIITEKVAMVLLEETTSSKRESLHAVNLKSTFLQEVYDKENILWSKAYTSPSKNDRASYYVQNLQGFISPSKVEIGSKVMHLSQVVGRVKTPSKAIKQKKDDEIVSISPTVEDSSSDQSSPLQDESKNPAHLEMKLRAKLFNDWAGMVNNTSMSDLMIYPQEGREIPTHKLILNVRCPRILKDVAKQCNSLTGNQVEVIMWSKTPHAAALAFLEYVYCGSVKSIRVLSGDLTSISWLATHYKISDLLQYLDALKIETVSQTASQVALNVVRNMDQTSHTSFDFESEIHECKEPQPNEINSIPISHVGESKPSCIRRLSKTLADASVRASSRSETDSIYSERTVPGSDVRSLCSSPDLFGDDETVESLEESQTKEDNQVCRNDVQSKWTFPDKLSLKTDSSVTERPPSATSISSEKTVICDNVSSNSRCSSIASANTDIFEKDPRAESPASSFATAEIEIVHLNQRNSKKYSLLSNESKRKLSNSSQDGDKSASKRLCAHVSDKDAEIKDSHVDFFDLTQDSDSSVSPALVKKNECSDFSDKVCISSDSELQFQDVSKESIIAKQVEGDVKDQEDIDHKEGSTDQCNNEKIAQQVEDAYVSPVWDGFEDLNYDDPFLASPQSLDMNKQPETEAACTIPPNNHILSDSSASNISPELNSEPKGGDLEVESPSEYETPLRIPTDNPKPSTSSGFDALLDDSLNINDTLLQQAECGKLTQRDTKGTPVNRILSSLQDDVTPLANYSAMKTPELKRELQKFGLKPTLGKRKGKIMLRHIYSELHPWVPERTDERFQDKHSLSQPVAIQASSLTNSRKLTFPVCEVEKSDTGPIRKDHNNDSDSDSDEHQSSVNTSLQEIKFMEDDCEEPQLCSQAGQPASKNLPKVVFDFITNDTELHHQVLEYEPIWIEKLHSDLRSNGYKFKMQDLMSFLDEKCITFRTSNSGSRVKKRKPKSSNTKKQITASTNSDLNEESN